MDQHIMFSEDTCVICGEVIPEGRQVCPICEHRILYTSQPAIPAPDLLTRFHNWLREKGALHGQKRRTS